MWPVLLDMTRDDCRRTLRRLELEAYASMISVFRAQGALEENRKKMLEDLRGALHINNDRHNAEARRVANDELLATIAEQLSGPNTGLGWISEGRRKIPLMPRGVSQTAYTEIADQAAIVAAEENKIAKKHFDEIDMLELSSEMVTDSKIEKLSFPIVMEDQTLQLLEAETPARKKFKSESDNIVDTPSVPSTMRVINQKHLNISQIYSSFSKPPSGKASNQQKHSYSQGSKASNKTNQGHATKTPKHRSHKQSSSSNKASSASKHQMRDSLTFSGSLSPMMNPGRNTNITDSTLKGNISGFQATFTQSLKKHKSHKEHYTEDIKLSAPDTQTLQMLTQGSVVLDTPNALRLSDNLDSHQFQSQDITQFHTPTSQSFNKSQQNLSSKSCHFIIKKKNEPLIPEGPMSPQKVQVSGIQMIQQKPAEVGGVKVLQNCQVFVTPSNTGQKIVNTAGKIIVSQSTPKLQPQSITNFSPPASNSNINLHNLSESKVIIVSNSQTVTNQSSTMQFSNIKNKNIIVSTNTPINKELTDVSSDINMETENLASKAITINSSDLKMPTKTLFLNSGHKMVVLPKGRAKTSLIHPMPVVQVKGIQGRPTMKLVPVNSQTANATLKNATNIAIVSKPTITTASTTTQNKILTVEATSTTKLSTEMPEIKIIQNPKTGPKVPGQTIIKPPGSKSNVIVVQKGVALNKGSLTFTRNGTDMPKIVMTNKVVNPVTVQSSSLIKTVSAGPKLAVSVPDVSKNSSNIIVLELSNDQMARAASLPDTIESEATSTTIIPEEGQIIKQESIITEDTPVLFDNQITEETCNTNSVDSITENLMDIVQIDEVSEHEKAIKKEEFEAQNTSNNNDWDMELDAVDVKQKQINDLSIEMGISSDSETDAYLVKEKPTISIPQQIEKTDREPPDQTHSFVQHDILNRAGRTLLSQLQDDGSSSNDSPFISSKTTAKPPSRLLENVTPHKLKINIQPSEKINSLPLSDIKKEDITTREQIIPIEKNESRPRIDIFSTAIASADINLDSFEYLEESIMSTDEMFQLSKTPSHSQRVAVDSTTVSSNKDTPSLDMQLSELLAGDNVTTASDKSIDSNYT